MFLLKERWTHITSPTSLHCYMSSYLDEIKQTIISPDFIIQEKYDSFKLNYYKYIKNEGLYLLVGVKYINDKGFIITAFFTRKIIRK